MPTPPEFPRLPVAGKTGLLLVGHGTRDAAGVAEFWELARQVQGRAGEYVVEPCFLELAQPDIPAAVRSLAGQGVGQMIVAPLLLFAAGHAKGDIPDAVREAVAAIAAETGRSPLAVRQTSPLECEPAVVELSAQRYRQAIAAWPAVDPTETLLLLIGRGSSAADAPAAMQRFADCRAAATPVGRVAIGFVAVATPALDEALSAAAQSPFRRIVVQPHLLFAGHVLAQISAAVAVAAKDYPKKQWIVTPHLGPSPLVVDALLALVARENSH